VATFTTPKGSLVLEEQQLRSSSFVERFEVAIDNSVQEIEIELAKWDDAKKQSVTLGRTDIPLEILLGGEYIENWFEMLNTNDEAVGEVFLQL
jgi:hypothetical protein